MKRSSSCGLKAWWLLINRLEKLISGRSATLKSATLGQGFSVGYDLPPESFLVDFFGVEGVLSAGLLVDFSEEDLSLLLVLELELLSAAADFL